MNNTFWKNKWLKNEIGFHQKEFNKHLVKYIQKISSKDKNCFVPLCGKSKDLIYLSKYFNNVSGVEVVEKAVHEFFKENNLTPNQRGPQYSWGNITLYNQDIFNFSDDSYFDVIFDRASLIALPKNLRRNYLNKIKLLSKNKGSKILLISIEYNDPNEKLGPPFSVTRLEVEKNYEERNIEILEEVILENFNPKFSSLEVIQTVYLITT
tara:strand:+ start:267 stop:893 length:627 start_codon:yes stop_codon:yes gene_type:complete